MEYHIGTAGAEVRKRVLDCHHPLSDFLNLLRFGHRRQIVTSNSNRLQVLDPITAPKPPLPPASLVPSMIQA